MQDKGMRTKAATAERSCRAFPEPCRRVFVAKLQTASASRQPKFTTARGRLTWATVYLRTAFQAAMIAASIVPSPRVCSRKVRGAVRLNENRASTGKPAARLCVDLSMSVGRPRVGFTNVALPQSSRQALRDRQVQDGKPIIILPTRCNMAPRHGSLASARGIPPGQTPTRVNRDKDSSGD
jgi:hypothetical protein